MDGHTTWSGPSGVIMTVVLLSLAVILVNLSPSYSQDVLGCGGFIKSDVDIDFSRIQVYHFCGFTCL